MNAFNDIWNVIPIGNSKIAEQILMVFFLEVRIFTIIPINSVLFSF